ncbi:MAG: S41 family peptidase [Clostridia bacterium]
MSENKDNENLENNVANSEETSPKLEETTDGFKVENENCNKSENNVAEEIINIETAEEKPVEKPIEEKLQEEKPSCFFETPNYATDNAINMGSTKAKKTNPKRKMKFEKAVSIAMSVVILVLTFVFGYVTATFRGNENATVAAWAVDQINKNAYFADKKVTSYDLMKYGIEGVLNDPYVGLFTPEETKEMMNQNQGKSYSIGMTVAQLTNTDGIIVIAVTKGSYADKAGVQMYYKLLEVDGVDCRKFTMDQMTVQIKSIPDNKDFVIKFEIPNLSKNTLDYSEGKTIDLTLRRGEFEPEIVTYYDNSSEEFKTLLDDKTAYIELDSFVGNTEKQFDAAMKKFKDNGKTKLILDMRDNGGGSDYNLQGVAKHLLKDGDKDDVLILTEKYKDGSERKLYTKKCLYDEYNFEKIIVLVNNNTASASEALLIAMKDYKTVDLIIGNTTYGKGTGLLIQTMPSTNYSIRFTASYFFSPYGNTNEKIGIDPTAGYKLDLIEKIPYSHATDNQFMRAVNSLK